MEKMKLNTFEWKLAGDVKSIDWFDNKSFWLHNRILRAQTAVSSTLGNEWRKNNWLGKDDISEKFTYNSKDIDLKKVIPPTGRFSLETIHSELKKELKKTIVIGEDNKGTEDIKRDDEGDTQNLYEQMNSRIEKKKFKSSISDTKVEAEVKIGRELKEYSPKGMVIKMNTEEMEDGKHPESAEKNVETEIECNKRDKMLTIEQEKYDEHIESDKTKIETTTDILPGETNMDIEKNVETETESKVNTEVDVKTESQKDIFIDKGMNIIEEKKDGIQTERDETKIETEIQIKEDSNEMINEKKQEKDDNLIKRSELNDDSMNVFTSREVVVKPEGKEMDKTAKETLTMLPLLTSQKSALFERDAYAKKIRSFIECEMLVRFMYNEFNSKWKELEKHFTENKDAYTETIFNQGSQLLNQLGGAILEEQRIRQEIDEQLIEDIAYIKEERKKIKEDLNLTKEKESLTYADVTSRAGMTAHRALKHGEVPVRKEEELEKAKPIIVEHKNCRKEEAVSSTSIAVPSTVMEKTIETKPVKRVNENKKKEIKTTKAVSEVLEKEKGSKILNTLTVTVILLQIILLFFFLIRIHQNL